MWKKPGGSQCDLFHTFSQFLQFQRVKCVMPPAIHIGYRVAASKMESKQMSTRTTLSQTGPRITIHTCLTYFHGTLTFIAGVQLTLRSGQSRRESRRDGV